ASRSSLPYLKRVPPISACSPALSQIRHPLPDSPFLPPCNCLPRNGPPRDPWSTISESAAELSRSRLQPSTEPCSRIPPGPALRRISFRPVPPPFRIPSVFCEPANTRLASMRGRPFLRTPRPTIGGIRSFLDWPPPLSLRC